MPKLRKAGVQEQLGVLRQVRARLWIAHLLDAVAGGLVLGATAGGVARLSGWALAPASLLFVFVAALPTLILFAVGRSKRTTQLAAARLERAIPDAHNLIVTAAELVEHPDRARDWIRTRVIEDAEGLLTGVQPADVVPLQRRFAVCAVIALSGVAALIALTPPTRAFWTARLDPLAGATREADSLLGIVVTLDPPSHTKLPVSTLAAPDRISAVEGTTLTLRVRGPAKRIRFMNSDLATRVQADARLATLLLKDSGYIAVEAEHRTELIPVVVTPDRAPSIKVELPGRDLLVPDAARPVAVRATATDDFGLAGLALRYTKMSGSGEQFEFVEGDIPLEIDRGDPRTWSGRAPLDLSRLGLIAGDSLIYRVIARDARTGDAGMATSDTFFIEVAGPGQAPIEGFGVPPDRERHALSQQMIVLKIERLRAREPHMPRDDLTQQAHAIATEQRAVRANFVFLMAGHVEDEEHEAEQSHELQEGRLENTAGRDISRAVQHMTQAEQALVAVDTTGALRLARLAVDALQRAFGRNRYILRTLPVRARVDPSRRLTGTLDHARDWNRERPRGDRDGRADAIRALVAAIVANGELFTSTDPRATDLLSSTVEQALAIDPTNQTWQMVSARLAALRAAVIAGEHRTVLQQRLDEVAGPLIGEARRVISLPSVDMVRKGPLHGAWAEEAGHK